MHIITGGCGSPPQTLQNFMYTMLQDSNKIAAKMSLDVIMELYRKNIWWVEHGVLWVEHPVGVVSTKEKYLGMVKYLVNSVACPHVVPDMCILECDTCDTIDMGHIMTSPFHLFLATPTRYRL